MELVEGQPLRALIAPGGLPLDQFVEIADSLADALGAAHARSVLHRDLKPENIMITPSGRVKMLDFGLAKFYQGPAAAPISDTRPNLTAAGAWIGTAPYMSPEQASSEAVDHRSDIFSLGIVFHELLTGLQPFRGRTVTHVLSAILRDDPPPIRDVRGDLPDALLEIIARCLAKRPEERFASASELRQRLLQLRRQIGQPSGSADAQPLFGAATPAPAAPARRSTAASAAAAPAIWRAFDSRWLLTSLLAAVWAINWIETTAEESWVRRTAGWVGYDFAEAFTWFEGGLSFDRHDLAGTAAVYLGSIAYFFVPVLLFALTLAALVPRAQRDGYRVFVFAIAVTYALTVPFYLLLPVPERWAHPESHAMLLSDLWSVRLIETIRPISGLDNCFPSFHVSGSVVVVIVWYLFRLPFRHSIACLGAAVCLSTFVLGIHWIADIAAGAALAPVSVRTALSMNAHVRARLSGSGIASDPNATLARQEAL
jgi:hypothetical protein